MLRVGLAQTASILNICVRVTVLFTPVGIDCCRLVTSGLQAYTQQYNEYTQEPSSTKQKKTYALCILCCFFINPSRYLQYAPPSYVCWFISPSN